MIFPVPCLRGLFLPLVVSVAFHAGLLLLATLQLPQRPLPRIEVRLPQLSDRLVGALLKNTLENALKNGAGVQPQSGTGRRMAHAQARQQRLAEHVFYPPQAVQQGMEGEVRLWLRLDEKGRLIEASIASSSGHALLDQAALAAAHATGAFPGGGGELMLPVVFRLSE